MVNDLLLQAETLARQGNLARAADVCVAGLSGDEHPSLLEALSGYLEELDFKHQALEHL